MEIPVNDTELDDLECDPCQKDQLNFSLSQFKIIAMVGLVVTLALGLVAALFIVDPGSYGH